MFSMDMGELINLIIDCVLFPILLLVLVKGEIPRFGYLLGGALCILISHIATVVEGYLLPDLFNLIEHLSIPAAGIFFIIGYYKYSFLRKTQK